MYLRRDFIRNGIPLKTVAIFLETPWKSLKSPEDMRSRTRQINSDANSATLHLHRLFAALAIKNEMKLLNWLSRAWPFIVVTFLGVVHYNAIKIIPNENIDFLNKLIASFTQVAGGLIVLSSINANLGLFRQISFMNIFQGWLKSFPYFRRKKSITGTASCEMPVFSVSAEGHTSKVGNTLEEKIEEAQRQIDELRKILYRKEKELLNKIRKTENNLKNEIYKNQNGIQELNELVSKSVTAGINTQVFGVLLVVYGAIIPVVT